jgi:hypothetical protein
LNANNSHLNVSTIYYLAPGTSLFSSLNTSNLTYDPSLIVPISFPRTINIISINISTTLNSQSPTSLTKITFEIYRNNFTAPLLSSGPITLPTSGYLSQSFTNSSANVKQGDVISAIIRVTDHQTANGKTSFTATIGYY